MRSVCVCTSQENRVSVSSGRLQGVCNCATDKGVEGKKDKVNFTNAFSMSLLLRVYATVNSVTRVTFYFIQTQSLELSFLFCSWRFLNEITQAKQPYACNRHDLLALNMIELTHRKKKREQEREKESNRSSRILICEGKVDQQAERKTDREERETRERYGRLTHWVHGQHLPPPQFPINFASQQHGHQRRCSLLDVEIAVIADSSLREPPCGGHTGLTAAHSQATFWHMPPPSLLQLAPCDQTNTLPANCQVCQTTSKIHPCNNKYPNHGQF